MAFHKDLHKFYIWADSVSDPRTAKWLFVPSILSPTCIILCYLLFIWLAPKLMKSREPFHLTNMLVVYNATMTVLNLYIFVELVLSTTDAGYSYSCQELKFSYETKEIRIASVLWWFYFSKIVELLDTVFFILRNKKQQVTFLHVYHHVTMVGLWWIGLKWVAGGQSFLSATINSMVHVIMYTYYGMSAVPTLRKYLWWKRHLTQFQLTQFCVLLCHGIVSLYVKCDYPLWMQYSLIAYMISFLVLFSNFYLNAYFIKKYRKHKVTSIANGEVIMNGAPHPLDEKKKEK